MTDVAPEPIAAPPEETPGLELRVLAGRAAGARAALAAGEVTVGHALDSDIVIRDPAVRGVFLKLRPGFDSAALEVLSGEVEFLGHVLTAPARAILPAYVPLLLGGTAVALGRPDGERWGEAEKLLNTSRPDAAPPVEAPAPPMLQELLGFLRKTPVVPALACVAAVAGAGAILMGGQAAMTLVDFSPSASDTQAALRKAGYRTLTVTKTADGRLVVRGLVGHDSDRARLEALVQAKGLKANVDVKSGEDIALGVSEVLRANGVTADVKPTGLGVVAVNVKDGGGDKLEAARKIALRDVGGLKRILFTGGPGLAGPVLSEDPNGAGAKRVLAVVAGDGGYVETADGGRYFTGAVLPTGHTIVAIAERDVTVQRDGQTTHLLF